MNKKSQRDIFLEGEGDAWYLRNTVTPDLLDSRIEHDPVIGAIQPLVTENSHIIEVGASNGWRLEALRRSLKAECIGIEPSASAIDDAASHYPDIKMYQGTADKLPCNNNIADVLILGFCLYLCDRDDLFQIASECNRVLSDGGLLVIYDFYSDIPYRNPYSYKNDVYSYKMNYSGMFLWNPFYRCVLHHLTDHQGGRGESPNDRIGLTVLVKNSTLAYVDNPYKK